MNEHWIFPTLNCFKKLENYDSCVDSFNAYFNNINIDDIPENFIIKQCKYLNPDLQKLSDHDAILHYIKHGKNENRKYVLFIPENFDVTYYKYLNPDLQKMSDYDAILHYNTYGKNENRKINIIMDTMEHFTTNKINNNENNNNCDIFNIFNKIVFIKGFIMLNYKYELLYIFLKKYCNNKVIYVVSLPIKLYDDHLYIFYDCVNFLEMKMPKNYIIFQIEQKYSNFLQNEKYLNILYNSYEIWNYSYDNILFF